MENGIFTFGEYLGQLLKEKQVSISKLAELTGTKSRNAIERLLKDSTGIKVIEAFASRLIETCELMLLPQEIELLKQSIEVSRAGKDKYMARIVLLSALEKRTDASSLFSDKDVLECDGQCISQQEYFQTNARYKRIKFLAVGACFTPFIYNYLSFFNSLSSSDTYVEQIFLFGNEKNRIADDFVSMYKLLNFDNYTPLYYESEENILEFAALKKTDTNGEVSTDMVIFFQDKFLLFNDNPGKSIFDFSNVLFQKILSKSKIIKTEFGKKSMPEELMNLSTWHYNLEKNSDEYFIKHNFCTQMIPFDIIQTLAFEINYKHFGYSGLESSIQEIIKLYERRCSNYYTVQKKKIHVFTKRGLLDFTRTGYISDHFILFRPLTKQEIRKTLELNLKQQENNPYFKIFLLKDDFALGNISINYYKDKYLCLFEESSGYGEDYFDIRSSAQPILELFDDFVENMLLTNFVYPESETIDFFKYLIYTLD